MKEIYLDNGSTTKPRRQVADVVKKAMLESYGNSNSPHELGESSSKKLEKARKSFARELGCKAEEIIFTSGGTESNSLVLNNFRSSKIVLTGLEHSSILENVNKKRIVTVKVNKDGLIDLLDLERKVRKGDLVSVIHGHNELGVLQDLKKIGKICKKKGAVLHVDAVQSFGKEKINVNDLGIDLLTASAHKIHGPRGAGLLFVKNKKLEIPHRGTEPVELILGFSKALELERKVNWKKISKLRDHFTIELEKIGGRILASKEKRLPNGFAVSLPVNADDLIMFLSGKGVYCSTRSACLTRSREESRSLKAIGLSKKEILGSLRFFLDDSISKKDVDYVVRIIGKYITDKIK